MVTINIYENAAAGAGTVSRGQEAPAPQEISFAGGSLGTSAPEPENIETGSLAYADSSGPPPTLFNGMEQEATGVAPASPVDIPELATSFAPSPAMGLDTGQEAMSAPSPGMGSTNETANFTGNPGPSPEPFEVPKGAGNEGKEISAKKK